MGLNLSNLKGADTKGFDAIPPGVYDCVVYEAKHVEVKEGSEGSLPPGNPGIKIQFKVDGGEYDNRRVFTNYWIPPSGHDKEQVMNNILASFLVAIGFDEADVTSGKLKLDYEDLVGRECRVSVGQQTYNGQVTNNVKGVKPRVEATAGSALL